MLNAIDIKNKNNKILEKYGDIIIEEYKKNLDFTTLTKKYEITPERLRIFLRKQNIYQPYSIKSLKIKAEKIKKTTFERYGVENRSQIESKKLIKRNSLSKIKFKFHKELTEYRELVNHYTKKNKKKLVLNSHCYYTGIKFSDAETKEVNPNCHLKRTIDHKISIIYGFFNKIPAEIIGHETNLVYCLRYCNTLKNATSANDENFKKIIKNLREYLINEGQEHN